MLSPSRLAISETWKDLRLHHPRFFPLVRPLHHELCHQSIYPEAKETLVLGVIDTEIILNQQAPEDQAVYTHHSRKVDLTGLVAYALA